MVFVTNDESQKAAAHAAVELAMKGKLIQLFSHADVHMYYINPEERSPTKRDTTTIKIVTIPPEHQTVLYGVVMPPAFLEAGGWFYPLVPSKTPVFRTEEKYYIFPDLLSLFPGATVGTVLPENITSDERDLFENILLNLTGLDEFPSGFSDKFGNPGGMITTTDEVCALPNESPSAPLETQLPTQLPTKSVTKQVDTAILTAAVAAVDVIKVGAQHKTFEFMSYDTGEAKFHLGSDYHDPEEHTGNAVEVSGFGISKLADATAKLGTYTSQYFKLASSALDNLNDQTKNSASAEMDVMRFVYAALHNAGKFLAFSIIHQRFTEFRYGARRSGHVMEYGPKATSIYLNNTSI